MYAKLHLSQNYFRSATIAFVRGATPAWAPSSLRAPDNIRICQRARTHPEAWRDNRARTLDKRQPRVDASIGTAARLAVEHLRSLSG